MTFAETSPFEIGAASNVGFCLTIGEARLDVECGEAKLADYLRQRLAAFVADVDPTANKQSASDVQSGTFKVSMGRGADRMPRETNGGQVADRMPRETNSRQVADHMPRGAGGAAGASDTRAPGVWAPEYRAVAGRREVIGVQTRGDIDLDAGRAVLATDELSEIVALEAEYFLRVVLALAVFEQGGLMLHAGAAERQGRGYAFVGPSGAGKTTAARNASADARFIHDDLIVLACRQNAWFAHATPFTGEGQWSSAPRPATVPICAIARLIQSETVSWQPLAPARSVAVLAAAAPVVSADALLAPRLLARLAALVGAVQVGELRLKPDPSYWSVLP